MVPKQSLFFSFFGGLGAGGGVAWRCANRPSKKRLKFIAGPLFIYNEKHNAVDAAVNRDLKIQTNIVLLRIILAAVFLASYSLGLRRTEI